jgi:beta-lactamase regulating signal transducer with metallopeptidase domain
MSSESALAYASLLLTYLLKTSAVYLLLSVLSRFIGNSQVRFWLHGLFLGAAVTVWFWLLVSFSLPTVVFPAGMTPEDSPSKHLLMWTISSSTLPALAKDLSLTFWSYAGIVALFLVQSCRQQWRLRNFLSASRSAPDALALVFELVRAGTKSPSCELRLVDGLRSPATTGWRHPKILLPSDLLPRLQTHQLVHVLQHEFTHVRRRDYLWDRLCTMGCYLIFFHPAAWLARRSLRWERELVCDDSVVPRSVEGRLQYASCLTTLAAWWFLEENPAGPVDFLSPRSSLLAARVRALLAKPSNSGRQTKVAQTVSSAGCLLLGALLLPKMEMVLLSHPAPAVANAQLFRPPHRRPSPHRVPEPRKPEAAVPKNILSQESPPPDFNFPAVLPRFSPDTADPRSYEDADSLVSGEHSPAPVWDESVPLPSRTRAAKAKTVALRVLRLGIGVAASQVGGHEHEKEH